MSYEILKSVTVKNNKVFTRQSSNNVYPKIFRKSENKYLTKIFKEEGFIELINFLVTETLYGNIKINPENGLTRMIEGVIEKIEEGSEYQKLLDVQDYLREKWFSSNCFLTDEIDTESEEVNKKIEKLIKNAILEKKSELLRFFKLNTSI